MRPLLWYIIGPIVAVFVIGAALFPGKKGIALLATAGIIVLIILPFQWIVDRTRLEISPQGVCLRQTGYMLEKAWPEVTGMRLMRGSEGFITSTPLTGKGAQRLASLRGFGMIGAPLYDAEQQTLLAERRFIPIEAFAWHLRHGELRADIARFAPHLREALVSLDGPDQRSPRKPTWKILALLSSVLLGAIALAASPKAIQDQIIGPAGLVFIPLFALRGAYSAWNSFRTRAWFLGVFFLLLTVVLFVWSIGLWIDFANTRSLGGIGN